EYDAAEVDIVLLNSQPDIALAHSKELHLMIIRYDSDLGSVITTDIDESHLLELFESPLGHVLAKQAKIDKVRPVIIPGQYSDVQYGQIVESAVSNQRSFQFSWEPGCDEAAFCIGFDVGKEPITAVLTSQFEFGPTICGGGPHVFYTAHLQHLQPDGPGHFRFYQFGREARVIYVNAQVGDIGLGQEGDRYPMEQIDSEEDYHPK